MDSIPMSLQAHSPKSDSNASPTKAAPTAQPLSGYEKVAEIMKRQDDVILEIDDLNLKIEAAIESLSEARKAERDASNAGIAVDANDPNQQPDGRSRKAA